jgi:hypothetical protein
MTVLISTAIIFPSELIKKSSRPSQRQTAFDARTLAITGRPATVAEGVRTPIGPTASGTAQFSISDSGTLIYVPGQAAAGGKQTFALMDRLGAIKALGLQPLLYDTPRISPNGKQLAFEVEDGNKRDVWVYDLAGTSAMRRVTLGGATRPMWSGNGPAFPAYRRKLSDYQGGWSKRTQLVAGRKGALLLEPRRGIIFGKYSDAAIASDFQQPIAHPSRQLDSWISQLRTHWGRPALHNGFPAGELPSETHATAQINVILNWVEELKQRVLR